VLCLSNSFAQNVNPATTGNSGPKHHVDPNKPHPKKLVNKNQIEQKSIAAHPDQTTDPSKQHEPLPVVKNPNKHVLTAPTTTESVQQKHKVVAPPQTAPVMQKGK